MTSDERIHAIGRMATSLESWAWRAEKMIWAKLASLPVGHTDAAGNVLVERGPGYYCARRPDGTVGTVHAPVPYI